MTTTNSLTSHENCASVDLVFLRNFTRYRSAFTAAATESKEIPLPQGTIAYVFKVGDRYHGLVPDHHGNCYGAINCETLHAAAEVLSSGD